MCVYGKRITRESTTTAAESSNTDNTQKDNHQVRKKPSIEGRKVAKHPSLFSGFTLFVLGFENGLLGAVLFTSMI